MGRSSGGGVKYELGKGATSLAFASGRRPSLEEGEAGLLRGALSVSTRVTSRRVMSSGDVSRIEPRGAL